MAAQRFSASSASQLMACPGSANLELSIPGWVPPVIDHTAGAKGVGSSLHEWLMQVASLNASNIRKLSEALAYVAEVRSLRRFKVEAEVTFNAQWLVQKPRTTVDLVFYVKDELHILDWKTGVIPVSPVRNEQLKFYALGFLDKAPAAKGAMLHIVQPWSPQGSGSYWCPVDELHDYMLETQAAEAKILAGDTTLSPSDHCTFCPANPHSRSDKGSPLCPVMMEKLYPRACDEDAIINS